MTFTERLAFQRPTIASTQARVVTGATFGAWGGRVEPLSGRESIQAAAVASQVAYRAQLATQQLEASAVSVNSITRSGTTATGTTAAAHGLATWDYARVAGATQTAYNGTFAVTVTTTTVYTYTVAGSPATPATGTITSTLLVPVQPTQI